MVEGGVKLFSNERTETTFRVTKMQLTLIRWNNLLTCRHERERGKENVEVIIILRLILDSTHPHDDSGQAAALLQDTYVHTYTYICGLLPTTQT